MRAREASGTAQRLGGGRNPLPARHEMSWQGADRFKLEGERCVEGRAYFDSYPLRQALEAAAERTAEAA